LLCLLGGTQLANLLLRHGFTDVLTTHSKLIRTIFFLSLFLYYHARNSMFAWYIIFIFSLAQMPIGLFREYGNEIAYRYGIIHTKYLFMLMDILICLYLLYKYKPYKNYTRDLTNQFRDE
jgi:hypothetical protein